MPVDPLISLTSSLHAGPGRYALLLGSGVSASSGVPSGWEVAVDLIGRLAVLVGEDPAGDPVAWYVNREGVEPDYSRLLAELAPSPADRRNLLERYFEPTREERDEGFKQPTPAHRSIADLVARAFVRVIVTTNFDRLLETALAEAGIQAQVISSVAHAAGATPLGHSRCTIIKVHGDYLSPDLRNTMAELATYAPEMNRLLYEVFDQYGLVICGWSAQWDPALRNAVLRGPGRRYATYWAHRGELSPQAAELLAHRDGVDVPIVDSDSFFRAVADKVVALAEAVDQRPQTTAIAVAQLKRYLPEDRHWIRLHDLVMGEVELALERTQFADMQGPIMPAYAERVRGTERAMATLGTLLVTGSYFGNRPNHDDLWRRCMERFAARRVDRSGMTDLLDLQHYAATLALYAIGIGSVAAVRISPLLHVVTKVAVGSDDYESKSIPIGVKVSESLTPGLLKDVNPELETRKTPISDHLHDIMRSPCRVVVPDGDQFDTAFDELEYFLGLVHSYWHGMGFGPVGRFAWRRESVPTGIVDRHRDEILGTGLFDGSAETLAEAQAEYAAKNLGRNRFW